MTLHELLQASFGSHRSRTALLYGDGSLSFEQVDALSDAAVRALRELGVEPGDRIALMGAARPQFVAMVLGALKLGTAVVLISPAWRRNEVRHALELTEPRCFVADGALLASVADAFEGPTLDLDAFVDPGDGTPAPDLDPLTDWGAREAALVFSSGTTGFPKAVVHTHASLGAATEHWAAALGLGPTDRFQIATPPSHILGLLNIFAALSSGTTVRLHERFRIDEMLRCVEADRLTLEMAVAPIALVLAEHPSIETYDLSSLRYIMWCATPVVPAVAARVTERTGVPFITAYGASEIPLISANPALDEPGTWRIDTAGRVIDAVEVRIVDVETGDLAAPGSPGELQARGPSLMRGYLPAAANAESFVDGWYRTGDIGYVEPGGWVHITDRLKEMIKVNGFQVAPAEVEAVLIDHPAVVDCAVFGVPDDRTGEAVVAAVVLAAGAELDHADLQDRVTAALAKYKRPVHVLVRESIPRTPSGKVLRRVMREEWNPDASVSTSVR